MLGCMVMQDCSEYVSIHKEDAEVSRDLLAMNVLLEI